MNVCPGEGVAYDSYYNETDRVNSSESQEDVSEIDTCLGENQCSCGQLFEDRKALDIHIKAVHLPSNWSCPHQSCSKFGHPYPNRYSLWKHIHTHHLNTWNYHCKEHNFWCEESMQLQVVWHKSKTSCPCRDVWQKVETICL